MKTKFHFLIIILCIIFSFCKKSAAQAPDWLWANRIGGIIDDSGNKIAIDPFGNIYTTGLYAGKVDFNPDPIDTFFLTSTGQYSRFISKSNSADQFIWALSCASGPIAFDPSGNIYMSGSFSGSYDFNPGPGFCNFSSNGSSDIFISKFDSSGNFEWTKIMGGPDDDYCTGIAIDDSGNIYSIGYFRVTIDPDPDSSVSSNFTSAGNYDIFISKTDNFGNLIWAKQLGGLGYDYAYDLAFDSTGSGYIYITGTFDGTVDFDPDLSASFNLTSDSLADIFISKLDSSGNFIWAKAMGGKGNDKVTSIALDASSNLYTSGSFQATADFDPDTSLSFNITAIGNDDIFISKIDSSGNFIWAISMGGLGSYNRGESIVLDASANIYITGSFSETTDFDPGLGSFDLTSNGCILGICSDAFMAKYDEMGNFVWAKAMGGQSIDYGSSIVLNASGYVYVIGDFISPQIHFDFNILSNADNGGDNSDYFIAKLDNLINGITSIDNIQGVSLFPNPANNQFTVTLESAQTNTAITITDIAGKVVYSTSFSNKQNIEINTDNIADGIYLVQINTIDFVATKKLIVSK